MVKRIMRSDTAGVHLIKTDERVDIIIKKNIAYIMNVYLTNIYFGVL